MRERLIELIYKSNEVFADCDCTNEEAVEILVDYLLDNGVIVPPCKVGDKAWVIVDGFRNPMEGYISRISFYQDCEEFVVRVIGYLSQSYQNKDFGKTVFLTREEAEAALKGAEEK